MKLKWHGHSCFSMAFESGATVVFDPFDESVGYPLCRVRADVALLSHDHHDHNHVQSLRGTPEIVRDGAARELFGLKIRGVDTFHDEVGGAKRGKNVLFVVEGEGLTVAHLGDLGHMLDEARIAALGAVDILLIPIGGTYTIDAPQAAELVRAIHPRTAIAMHFKTLLCNLAIADEREFMRRTGAKYLPNTLEITPEALAELPAAAALLCPCAH